MKDVYIDRNPSTDLGTPGDLTTEGFTCSVLELPWRNNIHQRSCITPGDYVCRWQFSNHFQRDIYHVLDVIGRDAIEIHSANWAGDVDKGFKAQLLGCFAPGITYGDVTIDGHTQWGILKSKVALGALEDLLSQQDFILHVRWKNGPEPTL